MVAALIRSRLLLFTDGFYYPNICKRADAEKIKEALKTLFENDSSAARPDGSMEVCRLYWWEHDCKTPKYTSAKVHRSLKIKAKEGVENPKSLDDYDITLETLDGLTPEVIDLV